MDTVINVPSYDVDTSIANRLFLERNYKFESHESWETLKAGTGSKLSADSALYFFYEGYTEHRIVLQYEKAIALLHVSKFSAEIRVIITGETLQSLEACKSIIKKKFPVAPEPISSEISVRFWYLSPNGPKSVHRNIAAPTWEAITHNYTSSTNTGLDKLLNEFEATSGGKLILWHGEPGTGKTYALRALCQAWRSWCTVEYIMDPEVLLGSSPGYLASMILHNDDDDDEVATQKWKLLIMEDTGELLTENAHVNAGQGLSRLLNVVDGFIGQGLRVLVLITTNQKFNALHPAVSREGRCAASIKFDDLNLNEVDEFFKANNAERPSLLKNTYSLAELYSLLKKESMPRDMVTKKKSNSIGFQVKGIAQKTL